MICFSLSFSLSLFPSFPFRFLRSFLSFHEFFLLILIFFIWRPDSTDDDVETDRIDTDGAAETERRDRSTGGKRRKSVEVCPESQRHFLAVYKSFVRRGEAWGCILVRHWIRSVLALFLVSFRVLRAFAQFGEAGSDGVFSVKFVTGFVWLIFPTLEVQPHGPY